MTAILQEYFFPRSQMGRDFDLVMPRNEHCLFVPVKLPSKLPAWDRQLAQRQLRALSDRVESYLELGRFHSLLPPDIAYKTVVELCDLPRLEWIYGTATLHTPPSGLQCRLRDLL